MQTIAVMAQKGGCGKTTLTTNLFTLAEGRKVGFDTDSTKEDFSAWAEMRGEPDLVKKVSGIDIERHLLAAEQAGMNWAFIDTPPHAEASASLVAQFANLAVVPVVPSFFDLRATKAIVDVLQAQDCPTVFVLNACTARTSEIEAGLSYLAKRHPTVLIADTFVFQRVGYKRAALAGQGVGEFEPGSAAHHEMRRLWDNLLGSMNS